MHVVLLGDSILDNKSYVQPDELDVVRQLDTVLGDDHQATLGAVDGSMIHNVEQQLGSLPKDATHLVVSMGGNDLIDRMGYLETPVSVTMEAMMVLSQVSEKFREQYHETLQQIIAIGLPTIVCTIYNPRLEEPMMQTVAVTAIQTFNDCIIQEVARVGLPLIELRSVCDDDEDFANPIEPSAIGGQKIVNAIKRVLDTHDFSIKRTQVYV